MTSKVLQIDLHDAGRDGIYPVVPDDPMTLVDDAARAGLRLSRIDLRDRTNGRQAAQCLAEAFEFPELSDDWATVTTGLRDLRWLSVPGHVLVLDHADDLRARSPELYAALRDELAAVARDWHARGVPFFVFMVFPDTETRDAAIDA